MKTLMRGREKALGTRLPKIRMMIVSLDLRIGNVFVLTAIRVHMYNLHFRALCNLLGQ